MITETFKIISHLKDILGRGLVTNEFVAVFELVKNGFDAGASSVAIEVDPEAGRIAIVDDGKGMARRDIIERWLFLAYSAKADNSEDDNLHPDYRDRIRQRDQFAGSKGIGRLSCDTLGTNLILYSRTFGETAVQKLSINWSDFEKDSKSEFGDIEVFLDQVDSFPKVNCGSGEPSENGTVLWITGSRHFWDAEAIRRLRRYLAKLIDPFGTTTDVEVTTCLIGHKDQKDIDLSNIVNGPIENHISDVLQEKTTRISVTIIKGKMETKIVDRGATMMHIREPYESPLSTRAKIHGDVYYLNRSAKMTFARRMGVPAVEFGSIFLFEWL